jgi:hypothetical protein
LFEYIHEQNLGLNNKTAEKIGKLGKIWEKYGRNMGEIWEKYGRIWEKLK